MDYLPISEADASEGKVVEGELMGRGQSGFESAGGPFFEFEEAPVSSFRRGLARLILGGIIGCLGVGLIVIGALLTVSIIGAALGIPLLIGGLALIFGAVWTILGGGSVRFQTMSRKGSSEDASV